LNPEHFQVKVFAREPWPRELGGAIPVFHRWIQSRSLRETLIDVADYRHVPNGPGVLLVAHDAHYALDVREGRLGMLYSRRTELDGSVEDKLRQALNAALAAARLIETEPEFAGSLQFNAEDIEIRVNDRLLAPNTDSTWEALRPAIAAVLDSFWGSGQYTLDRSGDPRQLFTVRATHKEALALLPLA
jgi:hypothetical protein